MANITKKVNSSIQSQMRYQSWNTRIDKNDSGSDISAGDVFRVSDSLGRPARNLTITTDATGSCSFRFNCEITNYPARPFNSDPSDSIMNNKIIASGETFTDTSQNAIIVEADHTLALSKEMPVSTIHVVTASGYFTVLAN